MNGEWRPTRGSGRSTTWRLLDVLKSANSKSSTTSKQSSDERRNPNRARGQMRFDDCIILAKT
ncbi:hypothetical protein ASF88_10725 [Leifsonia sp. Leaf336]|nr:hypothetical protein ASF88_10725 [Leifsonia sp. Leaf336]